MGDYATRTNVVFAAGGEERLLQLTDANSDGLEDASIVDDAIEEAEALINSYVRKKREVPVVPAPPILVKLAAKIAVYVLKEHRDAVTERDAMLHDDRIRWLENFAKGTVVLGVNPAPAASPHNQPSSTERPSSKTVSRKNLEGYS